jgi:hypothetical protein
MRFDPEGDTMTTMLDTAEHDRRKVSLMKGYEGRGGIDFEKVIDSQMEILINMLRTKYVGKVVNFALLSRYLAVDVATLAVTGKPLGNLPTESDVFKFFEIGDVLIPYMHCIAMWSALRRITSSRWFMTRAGPKRTDQTGIGKYMA